MNAEILLSYWPIIVFALLVVAVNVIILLFSHYIGERHHETDTGKAYESGISITGDARLKLSVNFYMIAMFFVIFDVEALFIILWALVFRDTGWTGYWGMFIFIMILFVVLVYEWRTGALDFGVSGKKILKASQKLNQKKIEDE